MTLMIFLYITILLFVLYSALILYYWMAWRSMPVYTGGRVNSKYKVSVIIATRNEENNIGPLLMTLQKQDYPKTAMEIIVVDDHSTDKTATVAETFTEATLIMLKDDQINSYKKKAIETGITVSAGDLIVTTDADCLAPPRWLSLLTSFKDEKNSVFVAAPVAIDCGNSILESFQAMDFMVLQGITAASVYKKIHSMCNGANLAYEKKVFQEVGGFEGIDHLASGDDMLLMHKIWKKYPGRVHYLKSKEAIVSTQPMKTWKEFFQQRIRWASKATQYNDKRILPVLLLVYLFNLSFLGLLVAGFWWPVYWLCFVGLWVAKTLVELPFFYSLAKFFDKLWAVKHFFLFQPLHIIYTLISGLFGQFGSYSWKGRTVK